MRKATLLAVSLLLTLTVTFAGAEQEKGDHHAHHGEPAKGIKLTLKDVMGDLGANMQKVMAGVLANNRLMIQEGAKAIATHPRPAGGVKPYLKQNADAIRAAMPELDRKIHETAETLAERAMTAPITDLATMSNDIFNACVGCHIMFRDE